MDPILFASAPERGRALARRWRGSTAAFACVLAHTDTCLIPGVSSAGATEQLRPLTPAADAEVVRRGIALCLPRLPSSPLGVPGPSGITRAALDLAGLQARFIGAGLRVWPDTECLRTSNLPGADIRLGCSVPDARELFEAGLRLGRECQSEYLVLGESVPGGTTTALAVLLALGYAAEGRVSGSVPGNAHALKARVVHTALEAAQLTPAVVRADPLLVVSRIGDPMQALATGMAIGASQAGCDVLLAGGSQMLAIAALMQALGAPLERTAVGTTRWVVDDPAADVVGLAVDISKSLALMAINLDFSQSRHVGLREYEHFRVKEGVGAGGACIAAIMSGASIEQLYVRIDAAYDELLSRLITIDSSDSCRR